ncbi:hypothetical protein J2I47_08275 [Fibrella sp. HMF5335]|uniref:Acyltransferase n=1 Tax=Fibrella rubiginis TaxID=2817060 RepID=A0A939K5J5_9BACT|nr:hypothetical protein [Fibrella rubiginis]MBO0936535.1 hypothetical protein [Fibrella rubiginis]
MQRTVSIEYLKAVLVSLMVLTHSFTLVGTLIPGDRSSQLCYLLATMGNLTVFSGFLFCFGYASYHAYLSKPLARVKNNLFVTAQNQLISYYISALLAVVLLPIPGRPANVVLLSDAWAVLSFQYIAPFSEFMLAYFLLTAITRLLFHPLVAMANSRWAMLIVGMLSLLATVLIPYDLFIDNPLGLFVGSRSYAAFPLVQYGLFYVAGIYFARFNVVWQWPIALLALAGTGYFALSYAQAGVLPVRFPPSLAWICGSWGILYGLYLCLNWLVNKGVRSSVMLMMGGNTLLFLLLSNAFLFALSNRFKTTPIGSMLLGIVVLMACGYVVRITRKPTPPAPVEPQQAIRQTEPESPAKA